MKPTQVAQALLNIASKIQASKNPDKNLVARDLKKIISSVEKQASGYCIIIHVHGDGSFCDVNTTTEITPDKPFVRITLPKGDEIIFARSLDDIKANMKMDDLLKEGLFNFGLIQTDDDGNYLI